jgi:hypothetical protein
MKYPGKRSKWIPGKVKPKLNGWYEAKFHGLDPTNLRARYWDGKGWYIQLIVTNRFCISDFAKNKGDMWRGLAKEPK